MPLKRLICALTLLCLLVVGLPAAVNTASAAAKYYMEVDLTNQIVTVYDNGNTKESGIVRQMICSSGASSTPTPTGTYTLPKKAYSKDRAEWYYFPKYNCYAKWATRIVGGILFHSVLYTAAKKGPTKSSVNALGSKASHGCIRLRVADAKWIAQNCPAGTKCRIYYSGKTNSALRKRLLNKSFVRSSETYDHFMGREDSDTASIKLSKGSKGAKVTELQARLKALGFLNDTVDGQFGAKTEAAVKLFQAAVSAGKTGKVDDALWAKLFADDAPTGTYVPLATGSSGPAVAKLQQALIALKLYEGEANGSYSADTAQAVMRFQGNYGYAVTGTATQAVQQEALAKADELKTQFGDAAYRLVSTTASVSMARVKASGGVTLRAKASSSGKALAKLKNKTEVTVLAKGKSWTKVEYDRQTGYIPNKYLTYFTGTKNVVSYAEEEVQTTETPLVFIPTPTPEVVLPTPTPAPTATATPAPSAEPSPSPTPEWIFFVAGAPALEDGEVVSGYEEAAVPEVGAELTGDGEALVPGDEAVQAEDMIAAMPDAAFEPGTGLVLEDGGEAVAEESFEQVLDAEDEIE